MSSTSLILNPSWKNKIELNNVFDEKFLNEKDLALQPLEFIFEEDNNITNDNINNINYSLRESSNEKSPRDSNLYNSNIIIIQAIEDDSSEPTSFNQIKKEIKKINKMIKNKKKIKKQFL